MEKFDYVSFWLESYTYMRFPLKEEIGGAFGGIILCFEDKYKARMYTAELLETGCFVEVNSIKNKSAVLNYQGAIHFLKRDESETAVLNFMVSNEFCPVLFVEGIVPKYLSGVAYILEIPDFRDRVELQMNLSEFLNWCADNIEEMSHWWRLAITSRFAQEYDGDLKELFLQSLCLAECARIYFRKRGVSEIEADGWYGTYVQWLLDMLNRGVRMTESCSISDTVTELVIEYLEHEPEVELLPEYALKMMGSDQIQGKKYMLYTDEYVYIPEDLFRIICKPILQHNSFLKLKQELAEDGVLCIQNLEKRNFTVKKEIRASDGKIVRPRFLRLQKDVLVTEDGVDIDQFL